MLYCPRPIFNTTNFLGISLARIWCCLHSGTFELHALPRDFTQSDASCKLWTSLWFTQSAAIVRPCFRGTVIMHRCIGKSTLSSWCIYTLLFAMHFHAACISCINAFLYILLIYMLLAYICISMHFYALLCFYAFYAFSTFSTFYAFYAFFMHFCAISVSKQPLSILFF